MFVYWPVLRKCVAGIARRKYLRPKFVIMNLAFLPAMLILRVIVGLFQLLDHVLFPQFRKEKVADPLFVLAGPRSGTTFLHRLLENDDQFVTIKLWHTIVPSITLYKVVYGFIALDRLIGSPLKRIVDGINKLAFGGWDGIHGTGLDRTEEDEQLFMYLFLSPGLMIFFPYFNELREAWSPDDLPDETRAKVVKYIRGIYQRHAYAHGGKTILAKNAVAGGRLGIYREAFPDMRAIQLIRHPYETVASGTSMFTKAWNFHSPQSTEPGDDVKHIVEFLFDNYLRLLEHRKSFREDKIVEFMYSDLIKQPRETLDAIYLRFGIPISSDTAQKFDAACAESRSYASTHSYDLSQFGVTEEEIAERLAPVFEAYGIPV